MSDTQGEREPLIESPSRARSAERVALIELLDRDGRVRRVMDVATWPLTIGRAMDNGLVLDDPHVAAHHMRLALDGDGELAIQVGDTINGVKLDRHALSGGQSMRMPAGPNLLQFGATRLKLRRVGELIPAEQPMRREARVSVTLICLLALFGLWGAQHVIEMDPGAKLVEWMGLLLGVPLGLAGWCVAWGLASKLFQHRFEFWPHVAIATRGLLAALVASMVLRQLGASLGWAWLVRAEEVVVPLILGWMVASHAVQVLPFRRSVVFGALGTLVIGSVATSMLINQHRFDRNFTELYLTTLPLPALRFASTVSPSAFVAEAAALRAPLEQRVKQASTESDAGEADDADE